MTPKNFEQQIAKIHSLLERSGAKVTWNDQIPDPDNPEQPRQVDVTIDRDGHRTYIECRLHRRPQDVKWVEELYGRKVSLRADTLIGVSSSGFTEGALKKAQRLGVILRDFKTLTDREVQDWGKRTKVRLGYIKFYDAELYLVHSRLEIRTIREPLVFQTTEGSPWPLDSIFKMTADGLKEGQIPEGVIRQQFFTHKLLVNDIPISEIIFQTNWSRLEVNAELPVVYVYCEPNDGIKEGTVAVEKFGETDFEIYRLPEEVVLIVDLSLAKPIEAAIPRWVNLDLGESVSVRRVACVGQQEEVFTRIPFQAKLVREGSSCQGPRHRGLILN